ncbi:hypothetical protein [Escherichia phage TR3]
MAIYDLGTASLAANGEVTGVGTTWKAPLTLIRIGATIVFKTEPVQIYTISEIISDTQVNVYNPNSETVPAGTGYAILAHDGITVQGLAQDVAETLRYYQSRETEVADAVDAFNNFDSADFESKVAQVNTQHGDVVSIGAQVSSDATQVSNDVSSSQINATNASSAADRAEAAANSVSGSLTLNFSDGGTLESKNQQVLYVNGSDVKSYIWTGSLPKTFPGGSTPDSTGGIELGAWVSVGDAALRSELASEKGALHIGNFASSSGVISAKLYGVVSGVDCSSIIQEIQDLSESLRLPIDFSGIEEVVFSGMVRVGDFFHWKSNGRFNTTIKPLTLTRTALGAAYSGNYGSVYAWFSRKNPATGLTFARLENIGFDGQYQGGYSTPSENLIRAFCWHSDGVGNIIRDIEANGCHFKNCPHEAWEGYTTGGGKIDGIRYINCSSEGTDPTVTAIGFNAFKCMNGTIDAPGPYGTYTIKNIVCRNSTANGHRTLADLKRGCEHWIIDGCQTYDMNDCHHSTDGSSYGVFTSSNEGVQTGASQTTKNYLEVQGEHITIEGFRYSASPASRAGQAGLFVTDYKYPSETNYHQSLYINILSASIERVNNSAIRLVNTSHCTVDGVWAKFCNGAAVSWELVRGRIDGTTLAEIVPTDNTQGSAMSYDNSYDLNVATGHNVTLSGVVNNNNGKTKVSSSSITYHGNKPYSVVKPNYLNYDRLLKNVKSTDPEKTDSASWPLGTGYAFTLNDKNRASIQSLSVATILASTKGWVYLDLYVLSGSSSVASVIFRELDSSGAALVNTYRPLVPNSSWELKSLIYAVTNANCAAVEILLAPAAASDADSALTGTTIFSDIKVSNYPI